ncbi:HNH endonuclease [Haladaptatus sp. ZSTT2]|uniref:HNH endonuclease n=1 Tax=Haladaptatus sp. ZSTT2 TaxID=3120515 RepID=UPI00300EAA5C
MDSEKALELNITVNQAGGGTVTATMHDSSVEERLQLLNARGATRTGDTWRLETDDMGAHADAAQYVIKMVSDILTPKETPGEARQATFERDGNTCRLCGANFDAPAIKVSRDRVNTRVLDHVYPQRDAKPIHRPHETCNLVTVCGGCDDVFLQGDKFRIVTDRLGYRPPPTDRQLIACIQKRGIIRSDWALDKLNASREEPDRLEHEYIAERLGALAQIELMKPLPDVAKNEGFEVYAVNISHRAIVFLDHKAVDRHPRLPQGFEFVNSLNGEDYVSMNEQKRGRGSSTPA